MDMQIYVYENPRLRLQKVMARQWSASEAVMRPGADSFLRRVATKCTLSDNILH